MPYVRVGPDRVWFEAGKGMALHKAANMYAQRPGAYPFDRPLLVSGSDEVAEAMAAVVSDQDEEGRAAVWSTFGPGFGDPPCDRAFVFDSARRILRGVLIRTESSTWALLRPQGVTIVVPAQALRGQAFLASCTI